MASHLRSRDGVDGAATQAARQRSRPTTGLAERRGLRHRPRHRHRHLPQPQLHLHEAVRTVAAERLHLQAPPTLGLARARKAQPPRTQAPHTSRTRARGAEIGLTCMNIMHACMHERAARTCSPASATALISVRMSLAVIDTSHTARARPAAALPSALALQPSVALLRTSPVMVARSCATSVWRLRCTAATVSGRPSNCTVACTTAVLGHRARSHRPVPSIHI